ncbi:hypothetical protein TVAG_255580 [Trichomonas vaginalis G3]|uniref:TOG domain-containing protein n=1 Tax=Trichomonas vaginalis (strain ATCC PRA-98 / G3) TaxID=412133 RepID=A2DYV5_TRIV3|nr:microtubule associated protein XMAP215 family [Trichomonas vaginalis G3]EAY14366.1 hypothetical protein TVAG_255580 [Trichomonas vaginalis G3]KAI5501292.1 microtubule associated protein XMAP215 family [Trichomonas vaginalis G3]|eukprot:XP_001326589.1 hypothetical protein [Trichomonas vaginalis G3]
MAEKSSDWKIRMEKYVNILASLQDENSPDLYNIEQNVIQYVSDVNPNSQLVGLQICEQLLNMQRQLNYQQLTKALLDKSFTGRPQNAQKATEIIKICYNNSSEPVMQTLLEELSSKSPKIVSAVMSIFSDLAPILPESSRQQVMSAIFPLLQNRLPNTRKEANDLHTKLGMPYAAQPQPVQQQQTRENLPPASVQPPRPQLTTIAKSTPKTRELPQEAPQPTPTPVIPSSSTPKSLQEPRKSLRKKSAIFGSAAGSWNSFVSEENKKNLMSHKPMDVTAGLDGLMKQFNDDQTAGNACAYGLFSSFVSRTFAPKVMNQLTSSILTYLKTDPSSISEDTYTAGVNFFIDKITEKRMEKDIFEIGDIILANISANSFFQQLYPSMGAKNPALLTRTSNYITHVLRTYGQNTGLDSNEIAEQVKPLTGNPDPNVRKAANEVVATLAQVYGQSILDGFSMLKKAQMDDIMKMISTNPLPNPAPLAVEAPQQVQISVPPKISNIPPQNQAPSSLTPSQQAPMSHRQSISNSSAKGEPVKLPKRNSLKPKPKQDFQLDFTPVEEDYRPPPKSQPPERKPIEEGNFPQKLIDNLSQSRTSNDAKKAIEELDNQCGKLLSTKGERSLKYKDVSEVLKVLGPWLSDQNVNILFSICKLMERVILLLGRNIKSAPVSLLSLLFNTLNFPNQRLKGAAMDMLNKLSEVDDRFVNEIFATAFRDLTDEGKSTALTFIMTVNFTPDVQSLAQLVADLITDQFEPENAEPFIEKFLENGGKEELKDLAKKMVPAKRSLIMRAIHEEDSVSIFVDQDSTRSIRKSSNFDRILAIKILNGENSAETAIELQWRSIFNLRLIHQSPDTFKVESAAVIAQIKKGTPDFSSYLDLILIWTLINRKLQIDFVSQLYDIMESESISLDNNSLSIALPLALSLSQDFIQRTQKLSQENSYFVENLKLICENSTNIDILVELFTFLKTLALSPEDKQFFEQQSQRISQEFDDERLKNVISTMTIKSNVMIEMSDELRERMEGSTLLVYEWIHQLSSPDNAQSVSAFKAISKQLEVDASVFNNHLDALVLAIIAKVHVFFAAEPPPVRLYKYIAFCIFSLLEKTDLPSVIRPSVVKQLMLEVITRLCNGVEDQMSNQSLNFIILKLMDTCTSLSFKALIDALMQCIDGMFPERWVKIALKCFDACVQHITQDDNQQKSGNEDEISVCVIESENVFKKTGYKTLKETELGQRIIQTLKKFIGSVKEQYPSVLERPDVVKALGQRSVILSI